MKVQFETIIDVNLMDVWKTFVDHDQRARWQRDFHAYEQVSGTAGHPGSIARLTVVEKNRERTLSETINERREANFLAATYSSDEGTALIVRQFETIHENRTRCTSWGNFRFHGIAKVTSLFNAKTIKNRMEGDMQRLKLLLETNEAGANH